MLIRLPDLVARSAARNPGAPALTARAAEMAAAALAGTGAMAAAAPIAMPSTATALSNRLLFIVRIPSIFGIRARGRTDIAGVTSWLLM